jgi:hypothetical protein
VIANQFRRWERYAPAALMEVALLLAITFLINVGAAADGG